MEDKIVSCPFNARHKMVQSSLQRHVLRCMVNYPNYVACPYNALHRFGTMDLLAEHMLDCDSKGRAHPFYEIDGKPLREQKVCVHVGNVSRPIGPDQEDWDRD